MIKQFPASLAHLHEMLNFVCYHAYIAEFSDTTVYQIELAVEEALVNVIKYAYKDEKGIIQIECVFDGFECLSIIISDYGLPYNPLSPSKGMDISSPLENKSLGGYGIIFILKIMDEIKYKYEEGKNILILLKYK